MHPEIQHCTKYEEILIGKLHFLCSANNSLVSNLSVKISIIGIYGSLLFSGPSTLPKQTQRYAATANRKNSRNFVNFLLWIRETNIFKVSINRNSLPEVFLGKSVQKKCSEFAGEHPCQSVISIRFLCNFIEITRRYWCSPVNLLHIF